MAKPKQRISVRAGEVSVKNPTPAMVEILLGIKLKDSTSEQRKEAASELDAAFTIAKQRKRVRARKLRSPDAD